MHAMAKNDPLAGLELHYRDVERILAGIYKVEPKHLNPHFPNEPMI